MSVRKIVYFITAVIAMIHARGVPVGWCDEASGGHLEYARAALRDGVWSVARQHAEAVGGEVAQLIVLESYASENRWDDVKKTLETMDPATTNAAVTYYRAAVAGRIEEAIQALRAGGSSVGEAEAKMLEADLQVRRGESEAARKLWREVCTMTNASERAFALASVNLGDETLLRTAYQRTVSLRLKRRVGLRLGQVLVGAPKTATEGGRLIRSIVADSPDTEGALAAFVSLASAEAGAGRWPEALKTASDAIEIWPDAAKNAALQEVRGEAMLRLNRLEDSLDALARAEECADSDAMRARVMLKHGDALSALGRGEEAMRHYRVLLEKYPHTATARKLQRVISIRELETRGRDDYKNYRFEEAMKAFREVAEADESRRSRMSFYEVLCLYGLGRDDEALAKVRVLATAAEDSVVRADAMLWLAKFTYNRGEWKEADTLFSKFAEMNPTSASAADALLWATRAAFASSDFQRAIQIATRLVELHPNSEAAAAALLVQAEALVEQARFDEALLVLERVAISETATRTDRFRATVLKADALFAMGADNPARYEAALEAYRAVRFGEELEAGVRLSVAFKIGRVLEKLRRHDEAVDQYYTQVVLAYREGRRRGERFGDEGRAAFARAAFRLADYFEGRGRDFQAIGILRLVTESGVPAAEEAERRIERISKKGTFL